MNARVPPQSAPDAWARAADDLAARATRRARIEAFSRPAAIGLAVAGALLLGAKATHATSGPAAVLATVAALSPALAGLVLAARTARRVVPTSRADAAWALDRLANARERGLVVATLGESAARSVAGTPVPPPPRARLRTGDGPILVVCAALVLLAAGLWQGPASARPESARTTDASARRPATAAAGGADAARRDADAKALAATAATERAIREALGLPREAPLEAERVAERLADPAARKAALATAPPDSAAAAALRSNDPGAAEALARALATGAAEQAEALRREAASLRAADDVATIPPARRALVTRYLSSAAGDAPPTSNR